MRQWLGFLLREENDHVRFVAIENTFFNENLRHRFQRLQGELWDFRIHLDTDVSFSSQNRSQFIN